MKCYLGYTSCRFIEWLIRCDRASPTECSLIQWYDSTNRKYLDLAALVKSYRLKNKPLPRLKPGEGGLRDSDKGHMNEHYLRIKWQRRAEKDPIKLIYRF